jgi:hypothetical protein
MPRFFKNMFIVTLMFFQWTMDVAVGADFQQFEPPALKIVWDKAGSRKDSESMKKNGDKDWIAACSNVAKGLLIGKGPWAMGIFQAASCYIDDKLVAGRDHGPNSWILKYVEGEKFSTLTLRTNSKSDNAVSTVSYPASIYSMKFFMDQGFVDLASLRLLNELPVMGWVPRGILRNSEDRKTRAIFVPPSGMRMYKTASPPESLAVYSAAEDGGLVMPQISGKALRAKFVEPQEVSAAEQAKNVKKAKSNARDFYLIWKFDDESRKASLRQGLWVHDSRGAGFLLPELDAAINDAASQLNDAIDEGLFSRFLKGLQATAASGYVGVRYGAQVLSGDPLLKKTAFFGLVAEVRGGPVEGLRYYYDKVPSRKNTIDGLETSIEWSRHIVGKSFGLGLSRFVDRVDVTPKIGLWAFDAKLVDSYNDDGTAATVGTFKMASGMSFSIEAGVEWLSPWYTIRPWYSYDYANALNSVTSKKVTSSRVGLDTYWTAGPVFKFFGMPLKTALMGFFIYEIISLSSSNPNPTLQEGEREIVAVEFSGGYAGAGVAVSW